MRLYLSSFQLGGHGARLRDMVRGPRRGLVISNALDGYADDRRAADTHRQISMLADVGLQAEALDLREHDPSTLAEAVGEPDFLWMRGGNVFTLRMALARSGMDVLITDALREDRVVYAGFSAGACVLAPSLAGLEHCDPIEQCLAEHGHVRYDGLGVLDRPVVPHLNSPGHPESALLGEVARRYSRDGIAYWGLRDGQVLTVDDAGAVVL